MKEKLLKTRAKTVKGKIGLARKQELRRLEVILKKTHDKVKLMIEQNAEIKKNMNDIKKSLSICAELLELIKADIAIIRKGEAAL